MAADPVDREKLEKELREDDPIDAVVEKAVKIKFQFFGLEAMSQHIQEALSKSSKDAEDDEAKIAKFAEESDKKLLKIEGHTRRMAEHKPGEAVFSGDK